MGRIKVELDNLRSYISNLNGRINEYEALNARMESLNSSILATWKGDAKNAFDSMMTEYIEQAKQLGGILTLFKSYAQDAVEKFESVDTECATRIRNSF